MPKQQEFFTNELTFSSEQRPKRRSPKRIKLSDFLETMNAGMSQKEAAESLDICLSSFKRQFARLVPKVKWSTPNERKSLRRRHTLKLKLNSIIEQLDSSDDIQGHSDPTDSPTTPQSVDHFDGLIGTPLNVSFNPETEDPDDQFVGVFDGNSKTSNQPSTFVVAPPFQNTSFNNIRSTHFSELNSLKSSCVLGMPIPKRFQFSTFLGDIYRVNGPWISQPVNDTTTALVLFDNNLNVIACNNFYHQLVGYSPEEMYPSFSHVEKCMLRTFPISYYIYVFNKLLEKCQFLSLTNTWLHRGKIPIVVNVIFRKFKPSGFDHYVGYFQVTLHNMLNPFLEIEVEGVNCTIPKQLVNAVDHNDMLMKDHSLSFSLLKMSLEDGTVQNNNGYSAQQNTAQ